jgi:hypothetical protein
MLAGLAVRSDWMPVPVIAIVVGDDGALLVIEMVPDGLPVLVGAKVAVIGELAPGAIEIGNVNPVTE